MVVSIIWRERKGGGGNNDDSEMIEVDLSDLIVM